MAQVEGTECGCSCWFLLTRTPAWVQRLSELPLGCAAREQNSQYCVAQLAVPLVMSQVASYHPADARGPGGWVDSPDQHRPSVVLVT
jgi:hypothetical protein